MPLWSFPTSLTKKCAADAKYFTVACRTGGSGSGGISLFLLERGMPGLSTRKLELQGGVAAGTAMITLDNVRVPAENMLGGEGEGFRSIMYATHDDCWHLCVAFIVPRVTTRPAITVRWLLASLC